MKRNIIPTAGGTYYILLRTRLFYVSWCSPYAFRSLSSTGGPWYRWLFGLSVNFHYLLYLRVCGLEMAVHLGRRKVKNGKKRAKCLETDS